jgi:hypothetical protein
VPVDEKKSGLSALFLQEFRFLKSVTSVASVQKGTLILPCVAPGK